MQPGVAPGRKSTTPSMPRSPTFTPWSAIARQLSCSAPTFTGAADLVAYLEQDDHFEFDVLPWPDYFGGLPHARLDGLRHTVMKPLAAKRLGELAAKVRGPLDSERLGAEVPRYLIGGRALIGRLLSAITAYPHTSLRTNSPLVELVTSDEGVVGAVIEEDGRRLAIRARTGVLLAAGGFENNPALRKRFGVPGDARDTMGAPANTGLALQAGIGRRRRDRPDGSGVVVPWIHPSRWALRVLAVVHRRDLRRLRTGSASSTSPRRMTGSAKPSSSR